MQPRYQDIKSSQIKEVLFSKGVKAKVICGTMEGITGPVTDIMTEPEYFDIYMPAGKTFTHKTAKGHTAFIYLYKGNCITDNTVIDKDTAVLFDDGDTINITTQNEDAKFILLSGKPLNEPIAWGGPIVMNTDEELQQAFEELDEGKFIK